MIKNSKEHLDLTKETYFQHFKFAACIGIQMIYGGLQAVIHAIYPGILTKSASKKIKKLYSLFSDTSDNEGN
jgi:hypothetical protein|tara:strand:+ start:486 stop:701 length:216 start_codon:yes stop_codon:yes gene_type:complete